MGYPCKAKEQLVVQKLETYMGVVERSVAWFLGLAKVIRREGGEREMEVSSPLFPFF